MASKDTQKTDSTGNGSAREQARQMANRYKIEDKRSSLLLRLSVTGLAVVAIAAISLMIVFRGDVGSYTAGVAPAEATAYGGVVLASDTDVVEQNELDEIDAEDTPSNIISPHSVNTVEETDKPKITIYTDPACPYCAQFEGQYHDFLADKLANEEILLEYRPVAFMDSSSGGYSSRAGNAFMCMASESPENYLGYIGDIVSQGESLSADALIEHAGDNYDADISECVNNNTYRALVSYATNLATQANVSGTPTVLINEEDWQNSDLEFTEQVENAIATGSVDGDGESAVDADDDADIDEDIIRQQSEPDDEVEEDAEEAEDEE